MFEIISLAKNFFWTFLGNRYLEETSDSEVEECEDGENTTLRLDDWTVFRSDAETAHTTLQVKRKSPHISHSFQS